MQRPNPTEPANYRGSYTTASKEIVDIEIAMYQSGGTVSNDCDATVVAQADGI